MTTKTLFSALALLSSSFIATAQGEAFSEPAPQLISNVHVGFTYPLSTNGLNAPLYSNLVSMHALVGVSRREEAFCAAGVASIITEQANGFVGSGVANIITGSAEGFQGAGVLNYTSGSVRGMQASGCVNIANGIDGAQAAGFANVATIGVRGIQASGFINVADQATTQAAGFINVARHTQSQVAGFINIAESVEGIQAAGFINIAHKVTGVQLAGFINIADSSSFPIGLINIIGNGEVAIGASINDVGTSLFTFRSGGRRLYGIMGVGVNLVNNYHAFALQVGMGMHIPVSRAFRFNTEATFGTLTGRHFETDFRSSLKFMPSLRFGSVEIYAGPSVNYTYTSDIQGLGRVGYSLWTNEKYHYAHDISIGMEAGVQFHLNSRRLVKSLIHQEASAPLDTTIDNQAQDQDQE